MWNPNQFAVVNPGQPVDLFQPQYDRVNIGTTVTGDYVLFANAKGASGITLIRGAATASVTKTDRDTSMTNSGVLPSKEFTCMGVNWGMAYASSATNLGTPAIDRRLVACNGYMRFRVVDADILILPLIAIPCLNPIMAVAATFTSATDLAIYSEACGGAGQAIYRLPVPITIQKNNNFNVTLTFDGTTTLTTSSDIYVFLHSFTRRPGQ